MSISTQINRIKAAKTAIITAIKGKGVTVPSTATIDDLSGYVEQIQTGGSTSMNVQGFHGMKSVAATAYTASGVKLTVAKTGRYTVSWMGVRNTNSGTSGSQLYINNSAHGTANTSFTNTYAQSVTLTNVSLTAGQTVEVRARARSTSYVMFVGNLIIEQTA